MHEVIWLLGYVPHGTHDGHVILMESISVRLNLIELFLILYVFYIFDFYILMSSSILFLHFVKIQNIISAFAWLYLVEPNWELSHVEVLETVAIGLAVVLHASILEAWRLLKVFFFVLLDSE
jgi:hypothetical protein